MQRQRFSISSDGRTYHIDLTVDGCYLRSATSIAVQQCASVAEAMGIVLRALAHDDAVSAAKVA